MGTWQPVPPSGLSPRLRGNRQPGNYRVPGQRSIPALAGEPPGSAQWCASPGVYPRACGGTCRCSRRRYPTTGLSPRLRGNRLLAASDRSALRSIPALAGEPRGPLPAHVVPAVYPRACGGTIAAMPSPVLQPGLSPRLRGNPPVIPGQMWRSGSIPALAGEPRRLRPTSYARRVYPRACGGTDDDNVGLIIKGGLSPRLRGNRILRNKPSR